MSETNRDRPRREAVSRLVAKREFVPTARTFATGFLVELLAALRGTSPGDLVAFSTADSDLEDDLNRWSRLTGNSVVGRTVEPNGIRWVIRNGLAASNEIARRIGQRLWLYTNFDCNLACDYCCVRSSPRAPRRELGLARIVRIASEAHTLGVEEIFLTGGEPFLLPDIAEIVLACARAAPTTILTNGMLFKGAKLEQLKSMPTDRVTLQISLDSAEPELHDRHRGEGSWERAMRGVELGRSLGFRVRLAATIDGEGDRRDFERFLDERAVVSADRVIRLTALRGLAEQGVALARVDLFPEVAITDRGVYYHPVGADDDDLLITTEIFPLAQAFEAVRHTLASEQLLRTKLAEVFNCA